MIGGLTKSLGLDSFFGNDRSRPTMTAEQLGFNQEDYDALKERREGYTDKFEGAGGYADRARALGDQYGGFLNRLTDQGGFMDQAAGLQTDAAGLRASAGDRDYLMQVLVVFVQGLAEAQSKLDRTARTKRCSAEEA